jgi:predicted O-methyltransferase YrrM
MSQRQSYSDIMASSQGTRHGGQSGHSAWRAVSYSACSPVVMLATPEMDPHLAKYIDELYEQGRAHDAEEPDRLDRLRNLEPDTARLLAVLVRATGARRLLELGTSNGFSTLWLADAARSIDGRVVSVELDPARGAQALAHLSAVKLDALVELRTEDAAQTLKGSADAAWDMIFLDAERPAYVGYWPDLLRVLKAGGLLVVDNVLSHSDELRDFRQLVAEDPRVSEALAPTGAGALLIVKEAATVRS